MQEGSMGVQEECVLLMTGCGEKPKTKVIKQNQPNPKQ